MSQQSPSGTSRQIADAAIRVISRGGVDQASVRHVAAEVGLAPGTVQHHFPSRDALLVGAMNRVIERQLQRIIATERTGQPAARLGQSLLEIMPFDETRREEAIVWLVFSAAAPSRPSLRIPYAAGITLMRDLIRNLLSSAQATGSLRAGLDLDTETVLLAASVDGLMLHAINTDAEAQPLIESALTHAVDRLVLDHGDQTTHDRTEPPLSADQPS